MTLRALSGRPYLQVFGLQRSYAEAGEDAQIDIEWMPPTVGRCRLADSEPRLRAPLVSELETEI